MAAVPGSPLKRIQRVNQVGMVASNAEAGVHQPENPGNSRKNHEGIHQAAGWLRWKVPAMQNFGTCPMGLSASSTRNS